MKMNNKIGSWLERSFTDRSLLAASLLSAMLLTACFRGMEEDVSFRPGTGERVQATLTFDINDASTDVRTRSALDAGGLKLETVWVGVFDTQTGEMLGYLADRPRKNDGTRVKMNDNGGTWTVEDMDIWYYDNNPEVYIASVVNYEFVEARKVGDENTTDLAELLGVKFNADNNIPEVTRKITWDELRAISVVTSSIDEAMQQVSRDYNTSPAEDYALAMGFFNTTADIHTVIDHEGNTPGNARIPLTKNGSQFVSDLQPEGRIYLRRMQSDITVNINFSTTSSYDYVEKVNSIRYKVINKPVEMYLAEHAVDQSGGSLSDEKNYRSRSANSADWLEAGYESDKDWIPVTDGSLENGYTFTYSHYENKHWGIDWEMEPGTTFPDGPYGPSLPDIYNRDSNDQLVDPQESYTWKGYFDEVIKRSSIPMQYLAQTVQGSAAHRLREAKFAAPELTDDPLQEGQNPLFKTLCRDEKASYNNNASYILLEADMTWKSSYDGSVTNAKTYYIIHEGYTSFADGSAVPAANRVTSKKQIYDPICDFQTVRNTKYTYNLTFAGIYNIMIQAWQEGYSDDMHDDGYTGETWRSLGTEKMLSEGNNEVYSLDYKYGANPLYYFSSPDYIYGKYDGYHRIPDILAYPEVRQQLTWRIYERRPDGERNYGSFDNPDARFEWPEIKDGMNSVDDLNSLPDTDPIKQFYKHLRVHIGYNPDHPYTSPYYIRLVSLLDMSLGDFMAFTREEKEIMAIYNETFYWFITYDGYNVTDQYKNYPQYKRGLYLVLTAEDSDGCLNSNLVGAYEQDPFDSRADFQYFSPFYPQSAPFENTYTDVDFNVYSAVQGMSDVAYIRWYAGVAQYEDEENADNSSSSQWFGNGSGDFYEPTAYTIEIDGKPVATYKTDGTGDETITWHDSREAHLPSTAGPYYLAYRFDPNKMAPGDYKVKITASGIDENHVKHVEPIEATLRIVEKPIWSFDNLTFPQLSRSSNASYSYYAYAGLLDVGVPVYAGGYAEVDHDSRFDGKESSSYDKMVLRFMVDRHGSFKVTVRNPGSSQTRYISLAARATNDYFTTTTQSTPIIYNQGDQVVYMNTRDVIDNFDGPVEVAIFSNWRLDIYEIEWLEAEDQRPSLSTKDIRYSDYWAPSSYGEPLHRMHPYYPYYYNNTYVVVPGLETYVGFTDTNTDVEQYEVGIYSDPGDDRPVISWTIDAETYCTHKAVEGNSNDTNYYICPIYVPSDYDRLKTGNTYCFGITPIGDPDTYAPSNPTFFTGERIDVFNFKSQSQIHWMSTEYDYYRYYPNPYYSSDFSNAPGEGMEYLGLVLHGGTSSTDYYTNNTSYITFGGSGYPVNSKETTGRYFSFKTDRPGLVMLMASSTGSTARYFTLWKRIDDTQLNNGHTQVDDLIEVEHRAIEGANTPFALSTGRVDGLTEFIVCPEGGVNLYSIRFIPQDDVDDRESLNTSEIKFANWSTDPDSPIHPNWNDELVYPGYNPDDNPDDYDEYVETIPFIMTEHFESYLSFSDNWPRAQSYKLQIFSAYNFNGTYSNPDYEVEIQADDLKYRTYYGKVNPADEHETAVYTVPLHFDTAMLQKMQSNMLVAFVTPVGDPNLYRKATPQFVKLIYIEFWDHEELGFYPKPQPQPPVYPDDDEEIDYDGIYNSPYADWQIGEMMVDIDFEQYPEDYYEDYYDGYYPVPKSVDLYKGQWREVLGLKLKGSGDQNASNQVVKIEIDPNYGTTKPGSFDTSCWIRFPGSGYPSNGSNEIVLGGGRNITFRTDVGGKFLLLAWADNIEGRSYKLYKKNADGSYGILDEDNIKISTNQVQSGLNPVLPIVLDTGEVTEMTEFVICPAGGGSFLAYIGYYRYGSPAYNWDWEKGLPGYEGDPDGYKINSLLYRSILQRSKAQQPTLKQMSTPRKIKIPRAE